MSEVINDEAAACPSEVVVVDSTLTIESLKLQLPDKGHQILSKTIPLKSFPGAKWLLQCYETKLAFRIVNFPENLQKECSTEFSIDFGRDVRPINVKKTYFQSACVSYHSVIDTEISFTANLVVTKKGAGSCSFRKNLLDNMCGDSTFADFNFIVKEKQFKVHKSILSASSPVMHKLFTAEYQEKQTNECKIDEIEPDIFEALIRFMYSCTVPENLKDIAHDLYAAAHYYEIEALKEICLDEVQKNLSIKNVTESYALAFKYDLKQLSTNAWKIIKRDILKDCPENIAPMPPDAIAEILSIRHKKEVEIQAFRQMEEDVFEQYRIAERN